MQTQKYALSFCHKTAGNNPKQATATHAFILRRPDYSAQKAVHFQRAAKCGCKTQSAFTRIGLQLVLQHPVRVNFYIARRFSQNLRSKTVDCYRAFNSCDPYVIVILCLRGMYPV